MNWDWGGLAGKGGERVWVLSNDVHPCLSVKAYVQVDEMLKSQARVGSLNSQTKSWNVRMESEYEMDAYNCMKVK